MERVSVTDIDVTCCLPWRSAPDRIPAYERVRSFWDYHGVKVVEADSDPSQPFSLAEARNNAVSKATTTHVIVADADAIPDIGNVLRSVGRSGVTWPYTVFRHIDSEWATRSDLFGAPIWKQYTHSVGGIFVTSQETYWDIGGMDPLMHRCWGYEDNCFSVAAKTLASVHRCEGMVFSFNHSADRDMTEDNPNKARYRLYLACRDQPAMMRELIRR